MTHAYLGFDSFKLMYTTHAYLGFDSFKLMYTITPRLTSLYRSCDPDCAMTETFCISSVMI